MGSIVLSPVGPAALPTPYSVQSVHATGSATVANREARPALRRVVAGGAGLISGNCSVRRTEAATCPLFL